MPPRLIHSPGPGESFSPGLALSHAFVEERQAFTVLDLPQAEVLLPGDEPDASDQREDYDDEQFEGHDLLRRHPLEARMTGKVAPGA